MDEFESEAARLYAAGDATVDEAIECWRRVKRRQMDVRAYEWPCSVAILCDEIVQEFHARIARARDTESLEILRLALASSGLPVAHAFALLGAVEDRQQAIVREWCAVGWT